MFRKDILYIFFEHLKIDNTGNYFIELNDEICYLDVEDTAYVVMAVNGKTQTEDKKDCIYVLLTDDSMEELDLKSLYVGKENILYCKVKAGKFMARFSRNSYYQLAEFIQQEDTGETFFINLNGEKHFINNVSL